ncbi:MAG: ribose 5-phosphate isomerase B [Actinobacteria bacterium]|nr:MAG: ribose 5-phosphate isomerase B [Actinomycetota bacterium]
MKLAIGCDHAGYELKEHLKSYLCDYEIIDVGTNSADSVDYPDFAHKAAKLVSEGQADRAILVCGSGVGMSMAANKVPGIRAAKCDDVTCARLSREHNDANVLCLGARYISPETAEEMVEVWLKTLFEGGRHQRRVDKIEDK